MEFSANREEMLDVVNHLQRVVSAKTYLPVLSGILLSAEQGKLTLISYNLEIGIKKEIYANTKTAGDIVIDAKILGEILRRMNSPEVEISTDDRLMCHIKSGSASFDIMGMSATDFPEMPSVANENAIILSGEILKNMVRRTIFAVAQSEGQRPILTGVKVKISDENLQFVAIDGYRLAIRNEKVNLAAEAEFIVSGKSISEVIKLIEDENEDISIFVSKTLISFEIGGYVFISRLMEGSFVDYGKTIPANYKQRIFVDTKDFIDTIDRISPVINDASATPVRCIISEDNILLSCTSAVGRATENFPITLEGDEFEIGLNSRYLLDALKGAEQNKVKIEFNGATSGVLIKPVENDEFLYMIMPMRLK